MIESRFSLSLAAAFVCTGLAFSNTAAAGNLTGSSEAGSSKAAVCTACHGVNGNSANPEWSNLAGQNAAYVREQLAMIRDQKRVNLLMYHIVKDMTDQDFANVAKFFAAQTPTGLESDPSCWKAGEALYNS